MQEEPAKLDKASQNSKEDSNPLKEAEQEVIKETRSTIKKLGPQKVISAAKKVQQEMDLTIQASMEQEEVFNECTLVLTNQ